MEDGYRIWIERSKNTFGLDVRIAKVVGGQPFIAQPVPIVLKSHNMGEVIEPTFQIPDDDAAPFLEALKKALADHLGIREGYAEGELKATKGHLKDLHDLLWSHLSISQEEEK